MERATSRFFNERSNIPMYMERQGRSRQTVSDGYHRRRPRSRSPVSHRHPLPARHHHGDRHQPASYGHPASRAHHARPAHRSSDRYADRHSRQLYPQSKRRRLEQGELEASRDRRRDRRPSPATARPSSTVASVSRAPARSTLEPSVTFPELWGTLMTVEMEQQMDQWREEAREMLAASDPHSTMGHTVPGGSSRASSVRSRDGPLPQFSRPAEERASSKRSHDGQRRESSCAGSWRGGSKRSCDDEQDGCPSPAKMYINRSHPRFSRY